MKSVGDSLSTDKNKKVLGSWTIIERQDRYLYRKS